MADLYIQAKPSEEWVRPGGWLTMPTITSGDTQIAILVAVYENETNIFNFQAAAGTFNIGINWGDGTTNSNSSTTVLPKTYNYATLGGIVLKDEYGDNYKQALIIVTSISGSVTRFDLAPLAVDNKNNILDIYYSWSTAALGFTGGVPTLQRLMMYNYSYTGQLMSSYNLSGLPNLRKLYFPLSVAPTTMSAAFSSMGPVDFGDLTITGNPSIASLFGSSSSAVVAKIKSIGNLTALNINTSFSATFNNNTNIKSVGDINVPLSTNISSTFAGCTSLVKVGTITNNATTTIANICQNCYSLKEITFANLASVTTAPATTAFANCFSLKKLRLVGLKLTVSLASTALEKDELVQVFTDLGIAATTQTITVTRTPGSANLTAGDIAIATGKNWTVVL